MMSCTALPVGDGSRSWVPRALAALLLCLAALQPAVAQTVLRLARIENIPDQAVGAELLREVYRRAGVAVEFVDLPAKRALVESSSGRLDGEVHRIFDVQREFPTLIALQPPINQIEPTVFSRGLRFPVAGWDSIRPYSIGIVRGVGSSERGTQGMARVEPVASMEQLMTMLDGGRFEVAVNDRFSGLLVNRRLRLETRVLPLAPPLETLQLHHFLHERHRALLPRIEAELRAMQASGELARLRQGIMDKMLDDAQRSPPDHGR